MKTRFIGLDFGDRTIGVAVSCPDNRVATGIETITRSQPEALRPSVDRLREIIAMYNITHIVLGNPLHMDGRASERSKKTMAFRDKLQRNFKSIQIQLVDERLSTQAVARPFYENSNGGKKQKETYRAHVDEMAAVYILQGFLNKNKHMEETMENEPIMHDDLDESGDVILMTDDEGNEYQLHVLATKKDEDCIYLLAAVAVDDDEDSSEVLHFKCAMVDESEDEDSDEDDMPLELVDETHEDFERVMALFEADYAELGITIDEEDLPLGV